MSTNLDVIKTANHIIDLDLRAVSVVGTIVVTGTPEEVTVASQYTGHHWRTSWINAFAFLAKCKKKPMVSSSTILKTSIIWLVLGSWNSLYQPWQSGLWTLIYHRSSKRNQWFELWLNRDNWLSLRVLGHRLAHRFWMKIQSYYRRIRAALQVWTCFLISLSPRMIKDGRGTAILKLFYLVKLSAMRLALSIRKNWSEIANFLDFRMRGRSEASLI